MARKQAAPQDAGTAAVSLNPPPIPVPTEHPGYEVRLQHAPTLRCREVAPGQWEVWEIERPVRWTVEASDPFGAYCKIQGITGSQYRPVVVPLVE